MAAQIAETFGFDAPAEVVFGVLTDPDRTSRWLPEGMTTESRDIGKVQVRSGAGTQAYEVATDPERLGLTWRSVEDTELHGTAEVRDAPAGGSELRAEVALPESADEDRVRELLAEAARHLQRDVSDNFNAG